MNNEKGKNSRKFVFGNERFGGSYTPGEFEFNFPEDMSREDFEKAFTSRMKAFQKRGNELAEEFFDNTSKSKKEKLKTLSIRVKPHTKEFFKNNSILSPRDVLEMYENFNNGSEAFINSLIEDEKQLEKELLEVQEKLHNAKLFKEKLSEIKPENDVLTDEDKIIKLNNDYENSEIKIIGNETSVGKAKNKIIADIQMYNTLIIRVYNNEVLSIGVFTNAQPVVYYFKNEYKKEDIQEILGHVEDYCSKHDISFKLNENSRFDE
ncbi:hypothetical protein [uncultured Methanobrevibacter sp.]|uniref:hypothetical protein n=1 Tax=uncultured Methanobrevibacter sp. TaxID=253161 RepID=UPI0025DFDB1C|nr:hypothetical protein [uncultured Methanobrevibacter sp.]